MVKPHMFISVVAIFTICFLYFFFVQEKIIHILYSLDKKMDKMFDNVMTDISTLKSDVSTLKSDVSTLKSDVSNLKGKVKSINYNLYKLSGGLAQMNSEKSTCSVFFRDGENRTYLASRNIVNIFGSLFISTSGHVAYDYEKGTKFTIEYVIHKGREIPIRGEEILFFTDKNYDLALIPIKKDSNLQKYSVNISNASPTKGEKFIGTYYNLGKFSNCECQVVSDSPFLDKDSPLITTNCPGKPSYSGVGYFNSNGDLISVHKSGIEYNDEFSDLIYDDDLNEASGEKKQVDIVEKCKEYPKKMFYPCLMSFDEMQNLEDLYKTYKTAPECFLDDENCFNSTLYKNYLKLRLEKNIQKFKKIDQYVGIKSRNPCSVHVEAYHLYNLSSKLIDPNLQFRVIGIGKLENTKESFIFNFI